MKGFVKRYRFENGVFIEPFEDAVAAVERATGVGCTIFMGGYNGRLAVVAQNDLATIMWDNENLLMVVVDGNTNIGNDMKQIGFSPAPYKTAINFNEVQVVANRFLGRLRRKNAIEAYKQISQVMAQHNADAVQVGANTLIYAIDGKPVLSVRHEFLPLICVVDVAPNVPQPIIDILKAYKFAGI